MVRPTTKRRLPESDSMQELAAFSDTHEEPELEEESQDPAFAARFEGAGEAWDVVLQIAALRQQAGLSQKDLATILKTSQHRAIARNCGVRDRLSPR